MDDFDRDSRASDWFHSDNDYADYDIADVEGYYPGKTSRKKRSKSLFSSSDSSTSYSSIPTNGGNPTPNSKYTNSYNSIELLYRHACNYIEQRGVNESYQVVTVQTATKKRIIIYMIAYVCLNTFLSSLCFDTEAYFDYVLLGAFINCIVLLFPIITRKHIRIATDEAEAYFRSEAAKYPWILKIFIICIVTCLAISGIFELIYDVPSYYQGATFFPSIVGTICMAIITITFLIDRNSLNKYANDIKELIDKKGFGQQLWVEKENIEEDLYYLYLMHEGATRLSKSDSHRGIKELEDAIKEALYLQYIDPTLLHVEIFKGREKVKTVKRQ